METKTRILTTIFALLVLASTTATFHRYIIEKDFEIITDEELFQIYLLEE